MLVWYLNDLCDICRQWLTLCRICLSSLSIEVKLGLGVQGLTTSLDKLQATGQIFWIQKRWTIFGNEELFLWGITYNFGKVQLVVLSMSHVFLHCSFLFTFDYSVLFKIPSKSWSIHSCDPCSGCKNRVTEWTEKLAPPNSKTFSAQFLQLQNRPYPKYSFE